MKLQGAPTFSAEDYPDVPEALLKRLTEAFDELYGGLAQQVVITKLGAKSFTTGAGGTAYLELSTAAKPANVLIGKLAQSDGAEITATYSQTWVATNGGVRILFAGLAASTKHTCNVVLL